MNGFDDEQKNGSILVSQRASVVVDLSGSKWTVLLWNVYRKGTTLVVEQPKQLIRSRRVEGRPPVWCKTKTRALRPGEGEGGI